MTANGTDHTLAWGLDEAGNPQCGAVTVVSSRLPGVGVRCGDTGGTAVFPADEHGALAVAVTDAAEVMHLRAQRDRARAELVAARKSFRAWRENDQLQLGIIDRLHAERISALATLGELDDAIIGVAGMGEAFAMHSEAHGQSTIDAANKLHGIATRLRALLAGDARNAAASDDIDNGDGVQP